MSDESEHDLPLLPQLCELPPNVLDLVHGGMRAVELGERVAAFVLAHMFM